MSSTENDLRAALHDGDGDDAVDVDTLIAQAKGRRAQRRTRVLSTAAAVVVVAAVAGIAVRAGSGGGSGPQSAGTQSFAGPGALSTTVPPATSTLSCPADYPARSQPTGGLSSGAGGPMFAAPVSSVLVCGYAETGKVGSVSLTGSDATLLAQSIESASTSRLPIMCPDIVSAQTKELAIVASTSDGRQLPTVTTDVSIPNCNQPITNGTAVRWAWKPPTALESTISALTATTATGSGAKSGIPAR